MEKPLKRDNEEAVESETDDASEAAPADAKSNEEEGSVQSDASDALRDRDRRGELGGRCSIRAVSKRFDSVHRNAPMKLIHRHRRRRM